MALYVDPLRNFGNGKGYWKDRFSCHLIADDIDELMEFAINILKLDPAWLQSKRFPHFDLNEEGRTAAIKNGAIELDTRSFVKKMRTLRTSTSGSDVILPES